jgi:GrpB-like predicted nucleotidyltransferase (UPF0157 family)
MSESILLINTMQIEHGKLEASKESVNNSLAFVEMNGPQLMVEVYVDKENLRAYSFQVYRLLFRDYLRKHPATAKEYAQLKYRLA